MVSLHLNLLYLIKQILQGFNYKINGQLYVFMLDSNDCAHVNYKMVMYYCLKNEIEFKNQTFPALVKCRMNKIVF